MSPTDPTDPVDPIDSAGELAKLIAEQAYDDATYRLPADPKVIREADITVVRKGRRTRGNLDTMRLRSELTGGRHVKHWIFVQSCRPTERWEHDAVQAGVMECPGCRSRPLQSPRHYCIECDASGDDRACAMDGLPIDAMPRWEYVREYGLIATKYQRGELKGGID